MVLALFDDDGNLRKFKDFQSAALKIDAKYNKVWLKTEWNTAVSQANMASRWLDFEKDADLYPNLKYIQIDRDTKNQAHVKWHGIILSIKHIFWDTHLPPNEHGCGCDVLQTDEEENTNGIDVKNMPKNKGGFNINAGKHGMVASKDHPYFKTPQYKDVAKKAIALYSNFKKAEYLPLLKKKFKGKTFKLDGKDIRITNTSLQHMLRDPHKRLHLKNDLLLKLDDIFKDLSYVNRSIDLKNRSNFEYLYYKLDSFEDMYFVIRYVKNQDMYQLYSVTDRLKYTKK